jgi:zinc finger protein
MAKKEDNVENKKKENISDENAVDVLENQKCPFCNTDNLTLTEQEREIPYFGKVYVFSMSCTNCKYHKADVECVDKNEPSKYTIDVNGEEDMKIRIVKSSEATVKIPRIMTMEPGAAAMGYVTNIEGILVRAKHALDIAKENEEDESEKKKIKNMIKKVQDIMWGRDKITISIEDPTGNSAIISDKAVKKKL